MYALITMGHHVYDLLAQQLSERKSDYYEMTLHHIVTIVSYFATIANNQRLGYTLFFLHDIADIFSTMGRVASSMTNKAFVNFVIVNLLSSWLWTRLYVLPFYIWRAIVTQKHECVYLLQMLNIVLLCVLQALHIYWYVLIVGMVLHVMRTGKAEDTQSQ